MNLHSGLSRRHFLQAGAALGVSLCEPISLRAAKNPKPDENKSCILILNAGGPSHLDCWDMKPDAPREIRGPFKPIRTNNPDIQISEIFPLTAKHADKFSLVRSCCHTAAAVHDTGYQLMQTGRLFSKEINPPHIGCVVEFLKNRRHGLPAHVLLPEPMGLTGGNLSHGQNAGFLGRAYDPFLPHGASQKPFGECGELSSLEVGEDRLRSNEKACLALDLRREPLKVRERYGLNRFGQSCLQARRLVEAGVRFITLNTFTTVFHENTWDIHGFKPFSSIQAMKDIVAPMYDQAYSALLEDLFARGMLNCTLVACLAEFGRTPKINAAGGRDHWPNCWTSKFAGGGIQGGRVIGRSDKIGAYPVERPVNPSEIAATIYQALGIDPATRLPGPDSRPFPLLPPATPAITELF